MNENNPINKTAHSFRAMVARGGEMGAFVAAYDWQQTPLGDIENWPQSLKTSVTICLFSRFPMVVWWGPALTFLYNDAYRPILGDKHPQALGKAGNEIWQEIWHIIGPMLQNVYEKGEATWSDDQMLPLVRYGFVEEGYFTFSYSPIWREQNRVGGIFTAVTETTQRVIGQRRLRTLSELGARASEGKDAADACGIAAETLSTNHADIPFALLYLRQENETTAKLAGASGIEPGHPLRPQYIDLAADEAPWPLNAFNSQGTPQLVSDLLKFLPTSARGLGPWPEPSHSALVLPITAAGEEESIGFLIAGISSRQQFDPRYQSFLELVAGQVSTAVTNALAYEAERKRAIMLAELNQAKTDFFNNVSHEFRTPLTLMLAPLEGLLAGQQGELTAEQMQEVNVIYRNSRRLLKLVNTLLNFARVEAERLSMVFEATDLATYTAELASVFRSAIERANLRFIINCPPLSQPVYIDQDMWEQIILNLLSNALKFTFAGEIEVSLSEVGETVQVQIRDTGLGIPVADHERIFERFHRVRHTHGRTHEGTGIGLALVQEMVHLHHGIITLKSAEGEGSTFTITLPLGHAHIAPEQIRQTSGYIEPRTEKGTVTPLFVEEALQWIPNKTDLWESVIDTPQSQPVTTKNIIEADSLPNARILVVDDNQDMRHYLQRILGKMWHVEGVSDGAAALTAVHSAHYDLIISDVMMPRVDGIELLQLLRQNPRTSTIPIILLSARAGEDMRIQGLESGADDYLIKPFTAKELIARVNAQLSLACLRGETQNRERIRDLAARLTLAEHQERARIAQLLHDHIQQLLYGVQLRIHLLRQELPTAAPGSSTLSEVSELINSLLEATRTLGTDLYPPALHTSGLAAALRWLSNQLAIQHKLTVHLDVAEDIEIISPNLRTMLYQMVRELLFNVIKHAAVDQASVRVRGKENYLVITVADAGKGIDTTDISAEERTRTVFGLRGMRERLTLFGGNLEVQSEPGKGTRVSLKIPLAASLETH